MTGAVSMMTTVPDSARITVDSSDDPVNWACLVAPYNTTPATWSGVLSAALPVGTQYPDESWELAKFMQSPEIQTYFAETLHLDSDPARALAESSRSSRRIRRCSRLEEFPNTHIRPPLPNSQELWDEILRASDAALYHQMTPKEALDAANAKIQEGSTEYLTGNS